MRYMEKGKNLEQIRIIESITKQTFSDFLYALGDSKSANVILCTSGGDAAPAFAIYDYVRANKIDLTIHCMGEVESAGMVILAAGKHKIAYPHTTFMYHSPELGSPTRANKKKYQKKLDLATNNYYDVISKKAVTGDVNLDAFEALREGLIDEIKI